MSSKLALKQLQSLRESKEQEQLGGSTTPGIKQAIRNNKRRHKKQQQAAKQAAKTQAAQINTLEFYTATVSTQKATADIMSKLLGQPPQAQEQDSESDLDFDF